jgi:hypothetical protein
VLATFSVSDSLSAAEIISAKLPKGLSKTAVRLYTALVAVSVETARAKGYSANVTHMVMHAPLEQVAKACRLSRQSVWRHLPALKSLGVLDYRTHKGSLRGKSRNTGTVFMVRLNPSSGSKCRLSFADLKHHWRNLDRDIRAGRSSYRALKHTQDLQTGLVDIQRILNWTLGFNTDSKPVTDVCNSPRKLNLLALLDVPFAAKEQRAAAVDTAARALATALADANSLNFYRLIVWNAYRAAQRGTDYFQTIYQMAIRSRVDLVENFSRKGGAVFTSRLKQTEFWEELMRSP